MKFSLSSASLKELAGIHGDLIAVVKRAIEITECDFKVIDGLRSIQTQKRYVSKGKSKTMNSRHLTGHAVDLGAFVGGAVNWDWEYYYQIEKAMKQAANELGVPIEWGGDWRTFKDGPHYQLPWAQYPKGKEISFLKTAPLPSTKPKENTMLKGYKTYITAGLTVLGAIGAFLVGEAELANTIQLIVTALLAAFIRDGVKPEVKK